MYLNNKVTMLGGLLMVVLAVLTITSLIIGVTSGGDSDPFNKTEVASFLTDLDDNYDLAVTGAAVGIISDGFAALAVAAVIFVLFRDRSNLLAIGAAVGLAAAGILSATNDVLTIALASVGRDFVQGGAEGIPAGDPSILELGRTLGIINLAMLTLVATPLGLSMVSLGWLIVFAPSGAINPPRWLGWVSLAGGAAGWLSWLVAAGDPFFLFIVINVLATLVLFAGLGLWLLSNRSKEPSAVAVASSTA